MYSKAIQYYKIAFATLVAFHQLSAAAVAPYLQKCLEKLTCRHLSGLSRYPSKKRKNCPIIYTQHIPKHLHKSSQKGGLLNQCVVSLMTIIR